MKFVSSELISLQKGTDFRKEKFIFRFIVLEPNWICVWFVWFQLKNKNNTSSTLVPQLSF